MSAHGSVEISSTDSISSGLISPAVRGLEHRLDRVDQLQRLGRRGSSAPPRCRSCRRVRRSCGSIGARKRTRWPREREPGPIDHGPLRPRLVSDQKRRKGGPMALGYDGKLYILAFDHRGSFQKKMFGIEGDPTPEETATIADAKQLIYEGMVRPSSRGVDADATGVLVDEQFGGDIPEQAKAHGLKLAMPVEKSGQNEFDFQYGDDFGAHIEQFDPDFSKVLVRYNPDDPDAEMNREQLGRLKRLADWLHEHDRQFLFELLVPADRRAARPGRRRHRPLRRRAAARADAPRDRGRSRTTASRSTSGRSRASTSARTRRCSPSRRAAGEGREGVICVLLGRGASTRRSSTGCRRPRRSTASSASRSAARSGGTRSRASSTTSRREERPLADRRQLPALRRGLRGPEVA